MKLKKKQIENWQDAEKLPALWPRMDFSTAIWYLGRLEMFHHRLIVIESKLYYIIKL